MLFCAFDSIWAQQIVLFLLTRSFGPLVMLKGEYFAQNIQCQWTGHPSAPSPLISAGQKNTHILMMSGAKTSLIWLHTHPLFPLFGIEENAGQFGILGCKAGCISFQNKLWDSQFHFSGKFAHSSVVSHCTTHCVLLTQTDSCLMSFF